MKRKGLWHACGFCGISYDVSFPASFCDSGVAAKKIDSYVFGDFVHPGRRQNKGRVKHETTTVRRHPDRPVNNLTTDKRSYGTTQHLPMSEALSAANAVITIAIRLRYDYTIRPRRIARDYFHSTRFDASKKWTCQFFVTVVSLSYRSRIALLWYRLSVTTRLCATVL